MSRVRLLVSRAAGLALVACSLPSMAADFAVTPIRADLKSGMLSETVTVSNMADKKLRVAVRLMEWTQDADGKDVYKDSSDLVYFPRQMDVDAGGKRLVRLGAKKPAATVERTYRLFIEEEPEVASETGKAQVAFFFRFGLPVFVAPVTAKAEPDVAPLVYRQGKLSVAVGNLGNQHFRLTRVAFAGIGGFSQEVPGWYSLAGSRRAYEVDLPRDVCRLGGKFTVLLEGEGLRFERALDVDPASCV